jgi:hypothetical protein
VLLLRVVPLTQLSVYDVAGAFPAKTTEKNLDLLMMASQQSKEFESRAYHLPLTETATDALVTIPTLALRANKYMTWSSSGEPTATDAATASGTSVTATGSTTARLLADRAADCINANDYGALPGASASVNRIALQAAIDKGIETQKKVVIPIPGDYATDQPLYIMKFSGGVYTYCSCEIEGAKQPWEVQSGTTILSTRIVPTFTDLPAIIIQNGRGVKLKDIAVFGKNSFNIGTGLTAPYYPEMMTNTTFVNGGCRDSRYSPYAGICVDPFGTSVPADGGYPGLSAYYVATAAGSSGCTFEGVMSVNFVIGFCLTPNGTTQNNETVEFLHCGANYNRVGVAVCQSQSREVNWRGGGVAFNLIGFDTNLYGARTGGCPNIWGANMSGKYLFNVNVQYGAPVNITVYAESFASIGFLGPGASASAQPINFAGCTFAFSSMGGTFPDHHCVSYGNLNFYGCQFSNTSFSVDGPWRFYRRGTVPILFSGCGFTQHIQQEFPLSLSNGSSSVSFQQARFQSCLFQNDSATRGNTSGQAVVTNDHLSYGTAGYISSIPIPPGSQVKLIGSSLDTIFFDNGEEVTVSLGSVTVTTGASGTATFTVADGTIVRTGDLIYTTTASNLEGSLLAANFAVNYMCLGIVTVVAGNDITISGWPQTLVTGTFALVSWWWPKFHGASVGDTHTNTTLDNVTNPTEWKVGNKIRGTGIVTGTYITVIAGTTFTLSKATTATAAGVRLYGANMYKIVGTAV